MFAPTLLALVWSHQQKACMPVIARPRIRAVCVSETRQRAKLATGYSVLTVNVTLAFVRLRHEQVRHMPANPVLVAHGVAAKDLLQPDGELSVEVT